MGKDLNKEVVTLKCSNCEKELAHILLDTPNDQINYTFVAHCGWCQDKSYETKVNGLIKISGTPSSDIIDLPVENGVIHIKTKKVMEKRLDD